MAIKNKLFKFSTLAIIVTIAVVFCTVAEGGLKNYEEFNSKGKKTSAKSKLESEDITKDDTVVDYYGEDVAQEVNATPEPSREPTQAEQMGFEPIPGTEIPGINYRDFIDYNNFQGVGIVFGPLRILT